jgi:hypothetical protein
VAAVQEDKNVQQHLQPEVHQVVQRETEVVTVEQAVAQQVMILVAVAVVQVDIQQQGEQAVELEQDPVVPVVAVVAVVLQTPDKVTEVVA